MPSIAKQGGEQRDEVAARHGQQAAVRLFKQQAAAEMPGRVAQNMAQHIGEELPPDNFFAMQAFLNRVMEQAK